MILVKYLTIILAVLIAIAILISCQQEKILFYPEKLPDDFQFSFDNEFQELSIPVDKKTHLNGLLFRTANPKGLVFYLHGNAGSNRSWAEIAPVYLKNNYDFFILDYRGYGKSTGRISSEKQLLKDVQTAYDSLKTRYAEKDIVIIGYSIGTGPSAYLASVNNPKLLILKAPYYNIPDLAQRYFKLLPKFLIRYKLRTDSYIQKVKCPVVIFHGDNDEIIYTGSSYKLQKLFKPKDTLIILKNEGHNGINENPEYLRELSKLLK